MTTVEQGVLHALNKASPAQTKREPKDVEFFDINMNDSDGDDEDDDEVPQSRLAGRKKPGRQSVTQNAFNVKRFILTFAFSLTAFS